MQTILGLAETTKMPNTAVPAKSEGRVLSLQPSAGEALDQAAQELPDFTAIFGASDPSQDAEFGTLIAETEQMATEASNLAPEGEITATKVPVEEPEISPATADGVSIPNGDDIPETADEKVPSQPAETLVRHDQTAAPLSSNPVRSKAAQPIEHQTVEQQKPKPLPHVLESVLTTQQQAKIPPLATVPGKPVTDAKQKINADPSVSFVPQTAATGAKTETADPALPLSQPTTSRPIPESPRKKTLNVGNEQPRIELVPSRNEQPIVQEMDRAPRTTDTPSTPSAQPVQTAPKLAQVPSQTTQVFAPNRMSASIVRETSTRLQGEPSEIVHWDLRAGQTIQTLSNQPSAIVPRAELPPSIAGQIAAALHKGADKPIEIALNPPELGRVRMVLSVSETGMVVQVLSDRADTLDLMRRNIDDLGRALNDLGYDDLSFAFGQSDEGSARDDGTDRDSTLLELTEATEPPSDKNLAVSPLKVTNDGIDIRI